MTPGWQCSNGNYWVSYVLNLNGPSFTLDPARRAFAGGVNLDLHPSKLDIMKADGVISDDGKTRSFADEATGYVAAEGVGVLLLKPLQQAQADGDHIHAIIKTSVMNHDGHGSGFTVPNPETQQALIETALQRAGIDARTLSYIEAHGTGTAMGDAIEIQALTEAFARYQCPKGSCASRTVRWFMGMTLLR